MDEQEKKSHLPLYPVPQNAPHVSAGMNVLDFPAGQRPKATDVSPWYGVYRAASRAGFTLVELLVVMVIIGLLAALVLPNYMGRERAARSQTARTQIELLGTALDTFRLDIGRYPTSEEGLDALRRKPSNADRWDGPYLKKEVPQDPWGKPYVYRSPGEHGSYDLFSYGADGVPGGDSDNRDILSWEG